MDNLAQVILTYDGSWNGFLCCVHSYYYSNQKIININELDKYNPSFYENVQIITDDSNAKKVETAIKNKISYYVYEFLQESFLSNLEDKELYLLDFIVKGFVQGKNIINNLSDTTVITVYKAHKNLKKEAHRYLGLVRFYKAGEAYISTINPTSQILPLISWHFIQRFSNQDFMIYDKRHNQALIYINKEAKLIKAENVILPEINEDEIAMQKLWKTFYEAISIKERYNSKCRMNFMPKRTWEYLPEMQDM